MQLESEVSGGGFVAANKIASLLSILRRQYNLSDKDILEFAKNANDIYIPLSIFSKDISPFETIVKYLREELHLKNKDVSVLTNRDARTVSTTYNNSKRKHIARFSDIDFSFSLPLSIIKSRGKSCFETIVMYCHDELKLSLMKISEITKRNYRTVWTLKRRAQSR